MDENERWRSGRDGEAVPEPMFQLQTSLVVLAVALGLVELFMTFAPLRQQIVVTTWFAFIPDRYLLVDGSPRYFGGWGALVWTFLTHAFLHAGWVHLGFNVAMLAAVGRVVLERLGSLRFWGFMVLVTIAGAVGQLVFAWGSSTPMIGASGAVSGLLGGLMRFAFAGRGSRPWSIGAALADARVRGFVLALVFLNVLLVWLGTGMFGGGDGSVAWAVHLGGFVAGFLTIGVFWPPPRRFDRRF